jgi:hypothetical protein
MLFNRSGNGGNTYIAVIQIAHVIVKPNLCRWIRYQSMANVLTFFKSFNVMRSASAFLIPFTGVCSYFITAPLV